MNETELGDDILPQKGDRFNSETDHRSPWSRKTLLCLGMSI